MTKEAFENAIAVVMALGGSTNAVLHLLAIAAEARVELALDDFNKVAARVPHIADTKPHGKYHMIDIDRIGGVPVVMRHLLDAGLLHGDCLTVTGKTMAENLAELDPPAPDGEVVHPLSDPLHAVGGIAVLTGSLAPKGAVVKVAGIDHLQFEGRARVFDGEDAAMDGDPRRADRARRRRRDPLRGPEGRPRHARDARRHRRDEGRRPRRRRGADHRRSVLRRHPRLLHRPRRPEAVDGGPIAFVAEGDRILIDVVDHTIDLLVDDATLEPAPGRAGSCPSPATRAACWPSTPGSLRAPSAAPSPRPEPRHRGCALRVARRRASAWNTAAVAIADPSW